MFLHGTIVLVILSSSDLRHRLNYIKEICWFLVSFSKIKNSINHLHYSLAMALKCPWLFPSFKSNFKQNTFKLLYKNVTVQ